MSKSTDNDVASSFRAEDQPLASFRDEIESARSNKQAMASILARYDRLIRAKVGRFRGRGIDEDDLRQIALVALQIAIKKIPMDRLSGFLSYAATSIDNAVLNELRANASSNRYQWDLIAQYSKIESSIFQKTGNRATPTEVYERLGWPDATIRNHQSLCSSRDQSLNSIMNPLDENNVGFQTETSNRPDSMSVHSADDHKKLAQLNVLVESLPPDEKKLIQSRYWMKTSQKNFAKQESTTEYNVRKTETMVLAKLKQAFDDEAHGDEGMKG